MPRMADEKKTYRPHRTPLKEPVGPGLTRRHRHDPAVWMPRVCERLALGDSLYEACAALGAGAPTADAVLSWAKKDPSGVGLQYAQARETGYLLLGDKIDQLAAETHTYTLVPEVDADGHPLLDEHGEQRVRRVLVPLSSDVIASKRLQVDTLKWKLSKMLPKVYGERLTQQHVGPEDGAVKVEVSAVFDQILNNLELKRRGDGGE